MSRNRLAILIAVLFGIPIPALGQISHSTWGQGGIRVGASTTTCDGSAEGTIRWNTTDHLAEVCDGTEWRSIVQVDTASTDDVPDAFSFTDVTGQSLSALIVSNTANITGFDGPILASVTGSGSPQIQINGGAWASAGSIHPGDTLRVRQLSSASVSTAVTAVVEVGSSTDNWSVTTRAGQLRIFNTYGVYQGNLGGLTGADSICQTDAAARGYTGTWKAVLSDSTNNARDRLTLVYPIVTAWGAAVVAATNLWTGSLLTGPGEANNTWTGTNYLGYKYGNGHDYCNDWTSSSGAQTARGGYATFSDGEWVDAFDAPCDGGYRLLCIEQ